jgi:hypothetical protein
MSRNYFSLMSVCRYLTQVIGTLASTNTTLDSGIRGGTMPAWTAVSGFLYMTGGSA